MAKGRESAHCGFGEPEFVVRAQTEKRLAASCLHESGKEVPGLYRAKARARAAKGCESAHCGFDGPEFVVRAQLWLKNTWPIHNFLEERI